MSTLSVSGAAPDRLTEGGRLALLRGLTVVTVVGVVVGLYLALSYAQPDIIQGDVQRVFYIHMPAFIGAFLSLSLTVVGGVMYLRTRQPKWDTLALAGVEVGIALALINLFTGMVWARPIWNAWWTWDPRLTLEAVMVLTYAAYLMLRSGIEAPQTRRTFASVYGILAIITVILVLIITRIRPDTIHPNVIGTNASGAQGAFAMTDTMRLALLFNMVVWAALVPLTLLWYRVRLHTLEDVVAALKSKR
jgi:heme exporter protein C